MRSRSLFRGICAEKDSGMMMIRLPLWRRGDPISSKSPFRSSHPCSNNKCWLHSSSSKSSVLVSGVWTNTGTLLCGKRSVSDSTVLQDVFCLLAPYAVLLRMHRCWTTPEKLASLEKSAVSQTANERLPIAKMGQDSWGAASTWRYHFHRASCSRYVGLYLSSYPADVVSI